MIKRYSVFFSLQPRVFELDRYWFSIETGLYYLQSRYYDPAVGRFISADRYASTGQGLLGHNTYTYCGNTPVNCTDSSGQYPTHILTGPSIGVGITDFSSLLYPVTWLYEHVTSAYAQDNSREETKTKAISKVRTSEDDLYTVYFLREKGSTSDAIVYVGRVKTKEFGKRMTYHNTKGREYAYDISGLSYVQCRFIEQAGMAYHHSIRRGTSVYNQIRGVSVAKGHLFVEAIRIFAEVNTYEDNEFLPKSYIINQYENWLLNYGR